MTTKHRLTAELVALCERPEPPLGPETGISYFGEEHYRNAAKQFLNLKGSDFWVFAYGSLLWRPAFEPSRTMSAYAAGWRRDFCMKITRWRGTPAQPGLMMALRHGGGCHGLALRLPDSDPEQALFKLLKREVDNDEDLATHRWIEVTTPLGKIRALAFWAEPVSSRMFVELSLEEQSEMIAHACGSLGSGAAYLYKTIQSLEQAGISDEYLDRLSERIASIVT